MFTTQPKRVTAQEFKILFHNSFLTSNTNITNCSTRKLISSNGSTNKYKRQMTEANTVIIDDTRLYFGRTGRTNVMTPIYENELESDKCITGECIDSCCTCQSKETENCFRNEETQRNELQIHAKRSKIPVPVKLPLAEKSPSTPVKLPLLLPNNKMKYVEDSYSETLKLQPLLRNKKIIYAKELSDTTLKLPPLLPDKEQTCKQKHPFTNRPITPKRLPPLQNLPQNIIKTLIVNKIRDESKDKSKVMSTESMSKPAPQQPAETKASSEVLDMTPELGSKRVRWETKYRTFKLQKASRKNYYPSDRTIFQAAYFIW
ncbi:unnamed protein product [Mytilus edulis]|uniref:Uncharacterized protein n=1 Tax=Mytilus edulis TaxID=6550 RepID=A0A8S3TNR6_MYTED|nr:unnamed protein product [Mytilus edulis]